MTRKLFSKFSLVFIYTLTIFYILLTSVAIAGISSYILLRLGVLQEYFYTNPHHWLVMMVCLSLVIGLVMTAINAKLILKPFRILMDAMKELADGNFEVRVNLKGILIPRELLVFAEQFNNTAKELGGIEILRSDFVNNFSHEFKTPIVSLKGFAKLLKDGGLNPEEQEEYLDIIISESDRLASLATEVLNLSKIENQTIISESNFFDLGEQVRRAILMMESKWSQKELDLEIKIQDVKFYGNQEMLHRVWVNLMDNAVKFSAKRGKLEITLEEFHDSIVFKIQDYGSGMDELTQAHIFDKFYQGDKSHIMEGNGLGLTMVKKVVDLHQGRVTVHSVVDQGTLITVTLPKYKHSL